MTGYFGSWWGRRAEPERADGAAASGPTPSPDKWLPVIDTDYCTGCGECVAACPHRSLALVWSFATLQRPEACRSEGACVAACPEGLIRMAWAPAAGDRQVGRWR